MKGKQGETQETPRREEREKRTNKRRSWVSESDTLPPFIGSIHAPAPCARPRKAGRSPRPYPLVPRSVWHAATASGWGSGGHLWRALVLCISCRMRFTLHACSISTSLVADHRFWILQVFSQFDMRVYHSTHVKRRAEVGSLTLD